MEEKSKHLAEWAEKADYDLHWALFLDVYGSKKKEDREKARGLRRRRRDYGGMPMLAPRSYDHRPNRPAAPSSPPRPTPQKPDYCRITISLLLFNSLHDRDCVRLVDLWYLVPSNYLEESNGHSDHPPRLGSPVSLFTKGRLVIPNLRSRGQGGGLIRHRLFFFFFLKIGLQN